jgi:two-component system, OmpR family, response regulator MprA
MGALCPLGCERGRERDLNGEKHRILVVDDEKAIRELLCRILTIAGYDVEAAADGSEALERILARRPDLILLDLMMPVLDGWSVLDRLRDQADPPPVIVVSAYLDRGRAVAAGASGYLNKPFRAAELIEACERVLPPS